MAENFNLAYNFEGHLARTVKAISNSSILFYFIFLIEKVKYNVVYSLKYS